MTTPAYTQAEIEWISDLYKRIVRVTTRYVFTAPVEPADLERFADLLAAVPLPSGCRPVVERHPTDPLLVRVDVYRGARRYYRRDMIVSAATQ